jgi:hypothetical protein
MQRLSLGLVFSVFLALPQYSWAGTVTVDLDSVDASAGPVTGTAVTNLLGTYGISVSDITPGPNLYIVGQGSVYGYVSATPNILTLIGSGSNDSYTLNFSTPLSAFNFTRVEEFAETSTGFQGPAWTATAYNGSHLAVASVGEGFQVTFGSIPAANFSLSGADIRSVVIEGQTFGHQSPWINDLTLQTSNTVPAPSSLTMSWIMASVFGMLWGYRRWKRTLAGGR